MSAYQFLKARFAQIQNIEAAAEILGKDAETAMAPGSGGDRVNQMVALTEALHMLIADPKVEEKLEEARQEELPTEDRRNLQLMHHKWVHEAGLPADLAAELGRVQAEGDQLHTRLHGTSDWGRMGPWLKRSFDVMREAGEAKREKLGLSSAYEALVDQFSPGLRLSVIETEFAALDKALRPMIAEAVETQKREEKVMPLSGPFDLGLQAKLNREMAEIFGLDFNRGVHYAIKGHPSMSGSRDDVRITTRLDEHDLVPGIYGTIHETGHGVYQQNLPEHWKYQPVGSHMGMAVHESQSMIMEYQAGMSPEFLNFLAKRLQEVFNASSDPAFSAENIKRMQTRVTPSFIRVNADEMTYPMHVLLRTELEGKIIGRELEVSDLPDAWNEGMKERLGIVPENHSQGCMQDVHWPVGLIGYFPAYSFGAMGAAQFFQAAVKARPEIPAELGQGSTKALRHWLAEHVHGRGGLTDMASLYKDATGEALNSRAYLNHLSRNYLGRDYG